MSAIPGGAEYLPPVVTQLLGDNSDLLRAFAEAKAAEEAFTGATKKMGEETHSTTRKSGKDIDEFADLVVRRARDGESATATLRREFKRTSDEVEQLRKRLASEGANHGLYAEFKKASDELSRMRKLAQQIAPDLLRAGEKGGEGFLSGFVESFAPIGDYLVPILVGAVVLASPAIAALIGSAVSVGLGLGFIGIGAFMAAKLIPSIGRQFYRIGQNLKAAMKGALSGAFDDELRAALRIFNKYIPIFGKQLRRIFDALAPALQPLANALGEGLTGFLKAIADALPKMMPAILAFIDTIPEVMQAVADFLVAISTNGPALSRFIEDAAHAIVAFLDGAGKVIAWLEGAYLWVVKLNDAFPFIGWTGQLKGLKTAAEGIGAFFVGLWDGVVKGAKSVGKWFADLGKQIWEFIKGAGKAIGDWVDSVIKWFKELPGRVGGFLASLPGRVSAFFSEMAHKAAYWVGYLIGATVRFFIELPGRIRGWVIAAWNFVTTKFKEGVTATVGEARALPGRVATFFSVLWRNVTSWVSKTWHSAVEWFKRTRADIIEHISKAITAVIKFFQELPGKAATELGKFRKRALDFFKDAGKWLVDAGRDIVHGLIKGVTDAWDWAIEKIKSFGHDISKGFKDALGIHSPSTVFAEAGENSAIGYVKGWRKAWRAVSQEINGGTMTITGTAPGGAPRPPGAPPPAAPGTAPSGPLYADLYLDGQRFATVVTKPTQRRAERSGTTGLGAPSTRIM